MSDSKETTSFYFQLFRINGVDGETANIVDLDDFQVIFDPYNSQIRINLSGEQREQIKKWWKEPVRG
jgi:hypothetical protein